MAIIKKTEFTRMDEKTLQTKLIELKKELIKINIQISTGTLPENPGRIKEIKRTIAHINALIHKIKLEKRKQKIKEKETKKSQTLQELKEYNKKTTKEEKTKKDE